MANSTETADKTKAEACQQAIAKINTLTEEARQRLTFRLRANKAFVDKVLVNDNPDLTLPLPMDEVGSISVVGNKLTADNVKLTLLEKSAAGASKHKAYSVSEFIEKFDGAFDIVKDENTNVETMTIVGFSAPQGASVTIERVDIASSAAS